MRFFKYVVHKLVPLQNACDRKKGITQLKINGISSKVKKFIHTFVCNYMPNIGILSETIVQIFCSQGCPKRGITAEWQDSRRKKKRVRLVFMYMPYIKFQCSSISGSWASSCHKVLRTDGRTDGRIERWTDGQTDGQAQTNMPPPLNFSEVGGLENKETWNIFLNKYSTICWFVYSKP